MAKISWDNVGEKIWETGVDHCVHYTPTAHGVYGGGVPWNGIVSITEKPTGAEPNDQYADNIKYLTLYSNEEFEATIEAFTYPDEFAECDGSKFVADGVSIGQQSRKSFGLSYRTIMGNDVEGQEFGYKIHLIYGAMATPSERGYETVNDSPEAITLSWDLTTIPVPVPGMRPTSRITIDTTKADAARVADLEKILYGDTDTDPRLPTPEEVEAIFSTGGVYLSARDKAVQRAENLPQAQEMAARVTSRKR